MKINRKELTKRIMRELGGGVIIVELTDDQIRTAIDMAVTWGKSCSVASKHEIHRYASAMSKQMLGYVRSKYETLPVPGSNPVKLDAETLFLHARETFEALGAGPRG